MSDLNKNNTEITLEEFSHKIGHQFNDIKLLSEAVTHPSFSKYNRGVSNYQRLEFLGDKVLSLIISEYLMAKHENENEGDLSRRHAALVSGETLAEIALGVEVNKVLRLSLGEENLGGKTNKRNLENALEALVGAIYLDSDYNSAKKFIFKFWKNFLEKNLTPPKDPVSQLQEFVQLNSKSLPQYEFSKVGGSEHSPTFLAKLTVLHLDLVVEAEGKSKKEAQRAAAIAALQKIAE